MKQNGQFLEFKAEEFPIRMEAYTPDGTIVWSVEADSPGGLAVPGLRNEHGPVGVRMYCNGVLHSDTPPPDESYLRALDEQVARGEFEL